VHIAPNVRSNFSLLKKLSVKFRCLLQSVGYKTQHNYLLRCRTDWPTHNVCYHDSRNVRGYDLWLSRRSIGRWSSPSRWRHSDGQVHKPLDIVLTLSLIYKNIFFLLGNRRVLTNANPRRLAVCYTKITSVLMYNYCTVRYNLLCKMRKINKRLSYRQQNARKHVHLTLRAHVWRTCWMSIIC